MPAVAPARPSFADLKQRATALLPELRSRAEETERARRVSADVFARLHESQVLRLMVPERWGGFAYGYNEAIDVIAELGRACTSTAWCAGLSIVHSAVLAKMPAEAQHDLWGAGGDPLVCGSYAPAATAEVVPGGFRIRGSWSFASNCDNSAWALLSVTFPPIEETDGKPGAGFLLVPATDYEIDDNWHTSGLAGTGSKNVVIREPRVVPRHRILTFAQASSSDPVGARIHDNPVYRIPFLASVPATIAAPALGGLQGAIDTFVEMASARTTRGAVAGGGVRMCDFQTIQLRLAEAESCLDAARLLLDRDLTAVGAIAASGGTIDVPTRIRNRRDHAFALRLVRQGVDALNEAVGGAGLFQSSPIQRFWRDVHGVSKHVTFNWDAVGSMYGQHRLGLEPKGQY